MRVIIHVVVFLVIVVVGGGIALQVEKIIDLRGLVGRPSGSSSPTLPSGKDPTTPDPIEEPKATKAVASDMPKAEGSAQDATPPTNTPPVAIEPKPNPQPAPVSSSVPTTSSPPPARIPATSNAPDPALPAPTSTSLLAGMKGRRLSALVIAHKSPTNAAIARREVLFAPAPTGELRFGYLVPGTTAAFEQGTVTESAGELSLAIENNPWIKLGSATPDSARDVDWGGLKQHVVRVFAGTVDGQRHWVADLDPAIVLMGTLVQADPPDTYLVDDGRVPFDPMYSNSEHSIAVGAVVDEAGASLGGVIQLADEALAVIRENNTEFFASVFLDEDPSKVAWSGTLNANARRVELSGNVPKGTRHVTLRCVYAGESQVGLFPTWNGACLILSSVKK